MTELKLTRHFKAPAELVFNMVTQPDNLAKWWGPEGMRCPIFDLDLTKIGPWVTVMENKDGARFKVSGVVKEIIPSKSVTFTWAWHDADDARGHESQVEFLVSHDGNSGTKFILTQSGLKDEESAGNHNTGWSSSFIKLEALFT